MNSIPDYRERILSELNRRKSINPRYSLRAFAKNLGVSASFLSNVLNGNKRLSPETAANIAEKMGYQSGEVLEFCQLVQLAGSHSSTLRNALSSTTGRSDRVVVSIELDGFQVISDWIHFAILETIECAGVKPEARSIAAHLGVRIRETELALQRLVNTGLLKKVDGSYVKTNASISTPTDRPSQALRNFHTQMLEKAKSALHEQALDERDITSITLAINPGKLPEAKQEIKRFRKRMAELLEVDARTEVYQLNIQLFKLSKPNGRKS